MAVNLTQPICSCIFESVLKETKKVWLNFKRILSLRCKLVQKTILLLHPPKSDDKYAQLTRGAFIINDF